MTNKQTKYFEGGTFFNCRHCNVRTIEPEKKGTSRQRSGKGAIRKRFPLQKPRWEKTKLTIRYLYHETLFRHFFLFYVFLLLKCLRSRSISDHYLSCGNVTCSRPQRKVSRIEPWTSGTGINFSTPAQVRYS